MHHASIENIIMLHASLVCIIVRLVSLVLHHLTTCDVSVQRPRAPFTLLSTRRHRRRSLAVTSPSTPNHNSHLLWFSHLRLGAAVACRAPPCCALLDALMSASSAPVHHSPYCQPDAIVVVRWPSLPHPRPVTTDLVPTTPSPSMSRRSSRKKV
jgi:hypothetical protein